MTATPRSLVLAASVLTLALLPGCESTKKTKEAKTEGDEYVYVTDTGSRIPTKVKKSKVAADSAEAGKTLDALQRDQTQRTMMRDGR